DVVVVFVFFFQAEDGIRDRNVTGVQTCALPIWGRHTRLGGVSDVSRREMPHHRHQEDRGKEKTTEGDEVEHGNPLSMVGERVRRSEERRVGKESRSRGWTYQ